MIATTCLRHSVWLKSRAFSSMWSIAKSERDVFFFYESYNKVEQSMKRISNIEAKSHRRKNNANASQQCDQRLGIMSQQCKHREPRHPTTLPKHSPRPSLHTSRGAPSPHRLRPDPTLSPQHPHHPPHPPARPTTPSHLGLHPTQTPHHSRSSDAYPPSSDRSSQYRWASAPASSAVACPSGHGLC